MNRPSWTPELEVLDQLLGGCLPLDVVRSLFDDESHFIGAILAMLRAGDVRLVTVDGVEVPAWQWAESLQQYAPKAPSQLRLQLSDQGAKRTG